MASRTWLAVALSCLVWFGYLKWFAPPTSPLPTPPGQEAPVEGQAQSPTIVTNASQLLVPTIVPPGPVVLLENAHLSLEIGAQTGDIYRAALKEYKEGLNKDSSQVMIVSPETNPGALGPQFTNPELAKAFAVGAYTREHDGSVAKFSKKAGDFGITKELTLGEDYGVDEKISLSVPKRADGNWGYLIVPLGGQGLQFDHNDPVKMWEAVFSQNQKAQRIPLEKLTGETVHQGTSEWAAFGNRYFVGAAINRSELNPDIVTGSTGAFSGVYLRYPLTKKDATRYEFSLRYYLGPKDLQYLDKEPGLRALVDHGIFAFFAKPILFLLNFFYGFVRNYGVAIILLTLVVRGLFYPLSVKSYKSMKAMQKLQPQIQALKIKYKEDQQRFNQEQMALFKAHGVNPAGGCLPMLVQLPVFIALYAVLQNSIELFHAPFFGWVRDLSAKDPFYIYPVLMGISMFLQQRMTPTPGMDPMQQKMMYIMPLVFSFMMLNLPAGLTMYIFLSTILGILQQWILNREKHGGSQITAPA
ncbi:MAG: membrane protein insertase YidC, partial [Deltaproteobacteria bacterium]|nr:membrane protein insertase YidC [Deltaproteobacteria bacterium]